MCQRPNLIVSGEQALFDISLCAPQFFPTHNGFMNIVEGKKELWGRGIN